MLIDLTKEEAELILDMMIYAEDPCKDTFWDMMYDDLRYDIKDEDKAEEQYKKLEALSRVCFNKLKKIK